MLGVSVFLSEAVLTPPTRTSAAPATF